MTRATVLGLGTMGGRAAAALVSAGHEVRGFDVSQRAGEAARSAGVAVSESAEEALAGAEVVILSLPRPEHVLAVTAGPLAERSGIVVADLSTIDPASARTAAAQLGSGGVAYVDAPVLGRPDKLGGWTLPAGGQADAVEVVRQLLVGPVARAVPHVGDVGSGSTIKVLNNLMFGAINAVTAEVLHACAAAGLDPEVFVRTVADSGAATVSNLFREIAPKMVAGDYRPAFALDLLAKDNRLALDLARQVGAPAPVAELVDTLNTAAAELGHGGEDTGVLLELYRARSDHPR